MNEGTCSASTTEPRVCRTGKGDYQGSGQCLLEHCAHRSTALLVAHLKLYPVADAMLLPLRRGRHVSEQRGGLLPNYSALRRSSVSRMPVPDTADAVAGMTGEASVLTWSCTGATHGIICARFKGCGEPRRVRASLEIYCHVSFGGRDLCPVADEKFMYEQLQKTPALSGTSYLNALSSSYKSKSTLFVPRLVRTSQPRVHC